MEELMMNFNDWLLSNGFEKEATEEYSLSRLYLYKLYKRRNE